jgi:hypothetical protein
MNKFPIEAVGWQEGEDPEMPSLDHIAKILKRLWAIASAQKEGFGWTPSKLPPRKRGADDQIFSASGFKDGKPGGLDLLGTYHLSRGKVTVYVDSCRQAALHFGVEFDELIEVVLVHELTHLMTHKGFICANNSDHLWEYTAQCGTYAYLKTHGPKRALEVFKQLSPHQPFIYRTWETFEIFELSNPKCRTVPMIAQEIFLGLFKVPPKSDMYDNFSEYDE